LMFDFADRGPEKWIFQKPAAPVRLPESIRGLDGGIRQTTSKNSQKLS